MYLGFTEFAKLVAEKSKSYNMHEYFICPKESEILEICSQNYKNVSRETFLNLEKYFQLILKWNKSINLISRSEEHDIWPRHILDSLAIMKYISHDDKIIDIGSGGGFPGIVIGVLGNNILLIEIVAKKCAFLNQMKTSLSLNNLNVLNYDLNKVTNDLVVETFAKSAKNSSLNSNADANQDDFKKITITSRAFAKVKDILDMTTLIRCNNFDYKTQDFPEQAPKNVSRETFSVKYLLHKSKNQFAHEIEDAKKSYDFDLRTYDNPFNNLSVFVELQNVKKKK